MSDELVPEQDAVLALERELARTGAVVLPPARTRIVAGQLPGLVALCAGLWLVPQAIDKDGIGAWLFTAALLAAGLASVWQLHLGLLGSGSRPVVVTAEGLHDQATDGRLAWSDIIGAEVDERTVGGFTISRWVTLRVQPRAVRGWHGERSSAGAFVNDLREDIDTRLGGGRIDLPASLPDPVSLRKWLEEEVSRRARP